jgi:outer membrane protein assembly factor BamB
MIKEGLVILFFVPLLIFFACTAEKHLAWNGQAKGEIYDALFCVNDNKLIVVSEDAVACYSLDRGIHEWKNEQMITLYTPLFADGVLTGGAKNGSGIYSIDINTGEYRKKIATESSVLLVRKEDDTNFFFICGVTRYDRKFQLKCYNFTTDTTNEVFSFENQPKNQLSFYDGTIILHLWDGGNIYSIDKRTRSINWEKKITGLGLLHEKFYVSIDNSIFYIERSISDAIVDRLIQVDIKTGFILRKIALDSNFYKLRLETDGRYILLSSDNLQVYDIYNQNIIEIDNDIDFGPVTISSGNVFFHKNNAVYVYNIEKRTKEKIYHLRGKEIFKIVSNDNWVLLALADNLRMTIEDKKPFFFVVLKYPSI